MNRREFLFGSALALAGCKSTLCGSGCKASKRKFAINPPTVKGYKLSFKEQVELSIKAGYDGMEPWLCDLHAARKKGELADAIKLAKDSGFEFINGIAFGTWAVNDPKARSDGMEETKRDMAILAEIGCPCIAASMCGASKPGYPILPLEVIAERYGAVCDLGKEMGVRPLLEYWGHSVNLHTPEDALWVATKVGRPNVGILADVYHTYRGGGSFESFRMFSPAILPVLHANDYPLTKPRERLVDADRVWPGDGSAPWRQILANLSAAGNTPWLSLELFNPNYWKTTPLSTLKTGIDKLQRISN